MMLDSCICQASPGKAIGLEKETQKDNTGDQPAGFPLIGLVCLLLLIKLGLLIILYQIRSKNQQMKMDLNFVLNHAKQTGKTTPNFKCDYSPNDGSKKSGSFKKTKLRSEFRAAENEYATIQTVNPL